MSEAQAQASTQLKPHGNRRHPSQAARQKAYRERQRQLAQVGRQLEAGECPILVPPPADAAPELIRRQVWLLFDSSDPEEVERLRVAIREALADLLDIL